MNDAPFASKPRDRAGLIVAELIEALPFLQRYHRKTVLIKYGGHANGGHEAALSFARDVVLLKQCGVNPVVVHGGGPQIADLLQRLDMPSTFVRGMRVTDADTMNIVEMVLAGSVNKELVSVVHAAGGRAVGLCGKDAALMRVTPADDGALGYVGIPAKVDPQVLHLFRDSDLIPIVAPIGMDEAGNAYNVNADLFAGALAAALQAERLLFLTDVAAVADKSGRPIAHLTPQQARDLIADGTASGGMIPKLETCIKAVEDGVPGVVILDGRTPHAVLLELYTAAGAGTLLGASPSGNF